MKSQRLSLSIANAVAVVRFSNPPQEYMDDVTVQDLTAALDDIENNSDVRAVVLTGASEGTFVRHYDVRELEQLGRMLAERGMTFSIQRPLPENAIHACYRRIEESRKPFVAALNGSAMGGGFGAAIFDSCKMGLLILACPK